MRNGCYWCMGDRYDADGRCYRCNDPRFQLPTHATMKPNTLAPIIRGASVFAVLRYAERADIWIIT